MSENPNQNNQPGIEVKPIKEQKKIHGEFFVTVAVILLLFEAYLFLFLTIPPNSFNNLIIDFFYLLIFAMVFWSYIIVIRTPAGSIPLYWGFYIGDDDEKRKRYCLICNAFKPERSKHCSICNTCVLNMDHHCPWVNNCIGFFNRKYFMQFIFYLEILFIYHFVFSSFYLYNEFKIVINTKNTNYFGFVLIFINYIPTIIITFLFGKFVIYHIKLVMNNSSTIESLDTENKDKYKKFCLSKKENFEQVFGKNILYWFLPVNVEQAKPVGDGLLWKINEHQ
jgi:palmitoyltransferase